jgi:hypothetical protein
MALFGPRAGHDALFDEVCRFNEIDRKTKTVLQTVIKKYQLPRPAEIFVEPSALVRAMSDPDLAEENADLQKMYDAWFVERASMGKRR